MSEKSYFNILFSKDHFAAPFVYNQNDCKIDISDQKTNIIAKSIFAAILTIPFGGVGGLITFYCLCANYKFERLSYPKEKKFLDYFIQTNENSDLLLSKIATEQMQSMTSQELDKDWQLKEFFGQIFVINLEKDKVKKARFLESAEEVGLKEEDVFFLKATDGRRELDRSVWSRVDNNYCNIDVSTDEGRAALDKQHQGQAGCYMSHYRALKEAKNAYEEALNKFRTLESEVRGFKSDRRPVPLEGLISQLNDAKVDLRKKSAILIMEDDNAFGQVINEVPALHEFNRLGTKASLEGVGSVFRQGLKELPEDWEMLYLQSYQMYPSWQPLNTTSKIRKLKAGYTASAYVVNAKSLDKILNRLKKIDQQDKKIIPIDDEYAAMHREGCINAYGFFPSVAYQKCMGSSGIADQGDQVTAGKDCWQVAEWGRNAIIPAFDGQRFGDQVFNFVKALWLGSVHKIPVVYFPFKFSEQFSLSKILPSYESVRKYTVISNELKGYDPEKPLSREKEKELGQLSKRLFKAISSNASNVAQLYKVSFFTPDLWEFDDEEFRKQLQVLFKPLNPLPHLELPKGCCTVALHVRKGGGYDSEETIQSMPTKFPPESFYVNAIKYLADCHEGQKLFIGLFTDDPHPEVIAKKLKTESAKLGIKNEIEIRFRASGNSHAANVLEDFLAMTEYDCLVRGDSSFSCTAGIISGPRIEIIPPGWNEWKQKDKQGCVLVDRFCVRQREERGKGKCKKSTVVVL